MRREPGEVPFDRQNWFISHPLVDSDTNQQNHTIGALPSGSENERTGTFAWVPVLALVTCEPTCWKISPRLIGDERYSWAGPKLHVCHLPVVRTPVQVARDHISIAEDLLHHPHVSHAISPFYPGL